jgi:hypothetical protein
MLPDEELHWLWLASVAALRVWDDDCWATLSARYLQLARELGALSELPLALVSRAYLLLFTGELTASAELTDEAQAVKDATGSNLAPYGALGLAAFRGDEAGVRALVEATKEEVTGAARASASRSPNGPAPCSATALASTTTRWPRPSGPPLTS